MPSIKSFNLLPCPFCGGEAVMVMYYDDNEDEWELYAECGSRNCDVVPKTKMFNSINHHDLFNRSEWQPVKTKGSHKRAFPVKMCEDIISCFENSEVIFDPFMGSGTTAIAAINHNKKYIGFELSGEYCDIANKRISEIIK